MRSNGAVPQMKHSHVASALLVLLALAVQIPSAMAQPPAAAPAPPPAPPVEEQPNTAPLPTTSASIDAASPPTPVDAPQPVPPVGAISEQPNAALAPPPPPVTASPSSVQTAEAALIATESELNNAASDQASEDVEAQPIDIYGFADVYFAAPFWRSNSPYSTSGLGSHPYFSVGNFNIYLSKHLEERWHFLGEVRFVYSPNGANDPENPGTRISTRVGDTSNINRPFRWGAIEIERVHIDYQESSLLTLRFGQWLTPYGIWNIDHGSPTLIAIQRPYIVGEELFPQRQTGIQAFGQTFVGDLKLGYALGVSNGRGPMDEQRDLDFDKAITARLEVGYNKLGDLKVGSSYYRGRYTDASFPVLNPSEARADRSVLERYGEQSFGADLQWDYQKFVVRGEFAYNERRYSDGVRKVVSPGQVSPDRRRYGAYALFGYRTPLLGVMPYVVYQDYVLGHDPSIPQVEHVRAFHAGLNWPIGPRVTAKGEYAHVNFPGSDTILTKRDTFHLVQFQLAVAF